MGRGSSRLFQSQFDLQTLHYLKMHEITPDILKDLFQKVKSSASFRNHFMQLETQWIDSYAKALPQSISVLLHMYQAYTYTVLDYM